MNALQRTEHRFDRELHNGNCVEASINLRREFDKNPEEALAIIRHEQDRELDQSRKGNPNGKDKATIGIEAGGNVFVYDSAHVGYYAGTLANFYGNTSPTSAAEQPIPLAPPPPAPLEQSPYPLQRHSDGLHIPMPIEIGVHNGSLQVGVNIFGLAKGGITLGEQNRGYVGSDILKSEVSAGLDFSARHIGPAADLNLIDHKLLDAHARVGITPTRDGVLLGGRGDATALGGLIGAGGHANAEVGRRVGPDAGGYAFVGPAGAEVNGNANLSDQGLRAGFTGKTGVDHLASVATRAKLGIGTRNEAHVDGYLDVAPHGIRSGVGLYPQLRPELFLRGF